MAKIALISDVHFGRLSRTSELTVPGERPQDENSEGASLCRELSRRLQECGVQYLFVAGDLTSSGSPLEFCLCEEKLISIAQEGGIPPENIICGLGNHDIDWNISELSSAVERDSKSRELAEQKYQLVAADVFSHCVERLRRFDECRTVPQVGIVENADFIVFVMNSGWCCTKSQEFSHGKLGEDQLHWFEQKAKEFCNDKRWKIILIHHHPINYPYPAPSADISMIEEGDRLSDIAGENGINLILHGHRHHPKAKTVDETSWRSPVTYVCAGSLSVNAGHRSGGDIPNTFHILDLSEDTGVFDLYTFEYSSAVGWKAVKENRPELPLDHKMHMGRVPDRKEVEEAICRLKEKEGVFPLDSLEECLRFYRIKELKEKFQENLSETSTVIFDTEDPLKVSVRLIRK